jgi:hypothetical protein
MLASNRDGDITYYEELGINSDASPEQIREAFRLNVRLLHPDQQTDPQLKDIAGRQLRKLNRIYAVLSDPEERRIYNQMLDGEFPAPILFDPPSPALQNLKPKLAWAGAIAVSACLLIWLAADNPPGFQGRVAEASSPAPLAAPSQPLSLASDQSDRSSADQIKQLRSDLRAVIVERDAAISELQRLRSSPQHETDSPVFPPVETRDTHIPLSIADPPPAPRLSVLASPAPMPRIERPRPPNRQIAGFWFYATPPLGQINKNQALYPPEFIEATILEENGTLRGSLRARYHIADRAISPDVNFTFTGAQNGFQAVLPWTGAGGAKGDITMKLTSENSLRIDWTASDLGSLQGLNSGTAVLTRRIE